MFRVFVLQQGIVSSKNSYIGNGNETVDAKSFGNISQKKLGNFEGNIEFLPQGPFSAGRGWRTEQSEGWGGRRSPEYLIKMSEKE